jgi:glucokinase
MTLNPYPVAGDPWPIPPGHRRPDSEIKRFFDILRKSWLCSPKIRVEIIQSNYLHLKKPIPMQTFTGIDVGGSNVKFGLVDPTGRLLEKQKVPTKTLRGSGSAGDGLVEAIGNWLRKYPQVQHVGIGLPGMLSSDRRTLVEMVNIPELNNLDLVDRLEARHPDVAFHLENDANAAALGEFYFSGRPMPDNFLLVTLGTGIGSGAVINRRILTGGDGNALELGHIVSGNGRSVEQTIGKAGLIKMAKDMLAGHQGHSALRHDAKLDDDVIIDAANVGDPVARRVLDEYGRVLGQALVSAIFILDIKNIYIGGGVAKGFAHMEKGVHESLNKFLTPYYLSKLNINPARLGNNAGILGAAALCFMPKG